MIFNTRIDEIRDKRDFAKGINSPINYEVRNTNGDWSPYFGNFEAQKIGNFETSCCWAFAPIEVIEDQLEFLWKTGQMTDGAKKFFTDNGYIDSDGDFYLSRRFIAIMSGIREGGNDSINFFKLQAKYGCIPTPMLPHTLDAQSYFDKNAVTQQMLDLGQQFNKYVNIAYETIGKLWTRNDRVSIQATLYQSPLVITIPVPQDVQKWNANFVKWDGTIGAGHVVELYALNGAGEYLIYDQYEPHLKVLSADYYIPEVINAVVSMKLIPSIPIITNPVKQGIWQQVWKAIYEYFKTL